VFLKTCFKRKNRLSVFQKFQSMIGRKVLTSILMLTKSKRMSQLSNSKIRCLNLSSNSTASNKISASTKIPCRNIALNKLSKILNRESKIYKGTKLISLNLMTNVTGKLARTGIMYLSVISRTPNKHY